MTQDPRRPVLLRAVLGDSGGRVVSQTRALSETDLLIQVTEPLPVGQRLRVQLSLRRHVGPIHLDATVIGRDPAEPTTVLLHFEPSDDAQRLQLAELLARLDRPAALEPAPERDYRVLVVDDNQLILDLFGYGVRKYFRRRQGRVRIDTAIDGRIAWDRLNRTRYDLAMVDCYLPVLGGARLVAQMRQTPALADVLVVAMSGGGPDARTAMLEAGADLFLTKPIVLRDLFSTLERLTQGDPIAEHQAAR